MIHFDLPIPVLQQQLPKLPGTCRRYSQESPHVLLGTTPTLQIRATAPKSQSFLNVKIWLQPSNLCYVTTSQSNAPRSRKSSMKNLFILTILSTVSPFLLMAQQASQLERVCDQPLEGVCAQGQSAQVWGDRQGTGIEVYVVGDGKLGDFFGIISVNCNNPQYSPLCRVLL